MSKFVFLIFQSALLASPVWAAVQKITIYEEPDQEGNGIILTKKYANLPEWSNIISKTGSFCTIGYWRFWDLPNFDYNSSFLGLQSKREGCYNQNLTAYNSFGFLGPEDFDTTALSLYEGNSDFLSGGREYVVTGPSENILPFTPKFAYSFGNSSWTLFTRKFLDGNSTCFTPNTDGYYVYTGSMDLNSSFAVQSVCKGCVTL